MIVGFLYLFLVGFQLSLGPITWVLNAALIPDLSSRDPARKGTQHCHTCKLELRIPHNPRIPDPHQINRYTIRVPALLWVLFIGVPYIFNSKSIFYLIFMLKETKDRNAGSIDALYYQMRGHDL
jgi:hypothetical protein